MQSKTKRWLWHRMPPRWKHRYVMKYAMARRQRWRDYQAKAFIPEEWANPRAQHLMRRLLRNVDRDLRNTWAEAIRRALELDYLRWERIQELEDKR